MAMQQIGGSMPETMQWEGRCEQHGDYRTMVYVVDGRRMGGGCPHCADESREAREAKEQARRNQYKADKVRRLLGDSGIPRRFIGRTFDNYRCDGTNENQLRALELCRKYAQRFDDMLAHGANVVMVGNPGNGKTHLAAAMAQAVMDQGRTVHFTTAARMAAQIKGTYGSQSEEQAMRAYLAPDLLLMDEIAAARGTAEETYLVREVLSRRYEDMAPVVLMGNCSWDDLTDNLGDRLVSRLREGGGPFIVTDWEDYRPAVAKDDHLPRRAVRPVDWSDGA